jgi:hypothetical protein
MGTKRCFVRPSTGSLRSRLEVSRVFLVGGESIFRGPRVLYGARPLHPNAPFAARRGGGSILLGALESRRGVLVLWA